MVVQRAVGHQAISASVVILTWNGLAHLEGCLPALMPQIRPDDVVIVVDNGSTDGSSEWVGGHFPQVRLVRNRTNLGFAAAVNQGIRLTNSRFVVALNDDTVVSPGWLDALVQAAESDPGVGMCASKMLQASRPGLFDSAGIEVDWTGTAWNRWHGEPIGAHPTTEPERVFGPCGGAALYRRAMLDQVGLFDERFFAYYEDVDLAWRAQRCGWTCLYVPQAELRHVHSATGQRTPGLKRYLIGRNKLWTLFRNYSFSLLWLTWPLVLANELGLTAGALLQDGHGAAIRGRLEAIKGLASIWRTRSGPDAARVSLVPPGLLRHLSLGAFRVGGSKTSEV